jgi:hypothetical protein
MQTQIFTFPTSAELRDIEAVKLPRLTQDSPIFRLFPFEGKRTHLLEWDQVDGYGGMQQIRGLNGLAPRVLPVGKKSYIMRPGIYGERMDLDEQELTMRAATANRGQAVNIDDLVMARQEQLLTRRLNRIEFLGWELALKGHFAVMDNAGVVDHLAAYHTQEYQAPVPWSSHATARPLFDLGNIAMLARGQDTAFDGGATAYMNRKTAGDMLLNTNEDDLGGRRIGIGQTISNINSLNTVLAPDGLPRIEIYDEGWFDESLVFNLFIPDGSVLVVGRRRSGAAIGAYRFTLNVNNDGSEPAPYTAVIDNKGQGIPRKLEIHDGHNGGPVIFFPGSLVRMNVN